MNKLCNSCTVKGNLEACMTYACPVRTPAIIKEMGLSKVAVPLSLYNKAMQAKKDLT
jgi:hypothetical protein